MKLCFNYLCLCLFFVLVVSFANAQLTFTPSMLDFGDVLQGNVVTESIGISSAETVVITSVEILGSADYSILSMPTMPYTLFPGESILVQVSFEPMYVGYSMGSLNITKNSGYPELVYLRGTGIDPYSPMISVPYSYDFGDVLIGSGGDSFNFSVNLTSGWVAMHGTGEITSISTSGYPGFTIGTITNITTSSTITLPAVLTATDVLRIPVTFNPLTGETAVGMLNFTCNDTLNYVTSLSGSGREPAPHIRISPYEVTISVMEGSSATGDFYVSNIGEGVLNFTIDDTDCPTWMSFSLLTGNVNGGDSLLVRVSVDATGVAPDVHGFYFSVTSNDEMAPYTTLNVRAEVGSLPLVADFESSTFSGEPPYVGHPPLTVGFYNNSHSDDGMSWVTINSYKWDFNNDGVFDSFEINPTYTYTTPGLYSVRLVIGTNTGLTASKLRTDYINITNSAPIVVSPLPPISMTEDTTWGPTTVSNIFTDPDGDNYMISCKSTAHLTASLISGYLTLIPALNWHGSETIVLKATDNFGASVQHNVLVTVASVNDAPILSIPSHLYFIRGSVYTVDFAPYINDPDNLDSQLSITISNPQGGGNINFAYTPTNVANTVGQLTVAFSSPSQTATSTFFSIVVNDNAGRQIATATFFMHVLEHFTPQVTIGATYQYTGQTVAFTDATLGNPDHWHWDFGDGAISTQQNPEYQYMQPGTYSISLSLGNSQVPAEDTMVFMPAMIHLSGTAVTVDNIPGTWTLLDSPYNLYGGVVIDTTSTVEIEDNVVVNLFNEQPLQVFGAISANGVTFQPQTGSGRWGGFQFSGAGLREPSSLTNCQIIDATLPLDITAQSPVLDHLYIAVSDTTLMADGEAIRINGSACHISNTDIWNYRDGITVEGQNQNRTTPTLSNIRVRNASNTQRVEGSPTTGVTLKGTATVDHLEVVNCSTGILIGTDDAMASSTPTLTNIRVRNSSNTQRSILTGTGIMITGNAAPHLTGVDITEVANGIVIDGASSSNRDTPTLTNIRVRNASNTSRSITNGLVIRNTPNVQITDAWFDDFAHGITIEENNRSTSTPILSNIRVRNASNTQRTSTNGITISGSVIAQLDDVIIDDYTTGLSYNMDNPTRAVGTPTLNNIRVRNSSNTTRQLTNGAVFSGLDNFKITDMEVDNFGVGIMITAPATRTDSTPTLSNIRVRNASNTQRDESIGIVLGSGVIGSLKNSRVETASVGILVADGNFTLLENNKIVNCTTGIRATGINPLPINKQLFILDPVFQGAHPFDFCALDVSAAGPWAVYQNTIVGYPKGVKATNADLNFHTNILWNNGQGLTTFDNINDSSTIQNSYNDISYPAGIFPGLGNINSDPLFLLTDIEGYTLSHNSPCIDNGNPTMPLEADGSIPDMGYSSYIHRASTIPSARFVVVGTQVTFTNDSWGHDYPETQIKWDVNNDGSIEGNSRNFSYTFDNPGIYNLRLRMQSGNLIDEKVYPCMVVASGYQLLAPANPALQKNGTDIVLSWDAVTQTVEGNPFNVPFYLVYKSDSPDGFYNYVGVTDSPGTSYTEHNATHADRVFYIVLGYAGTRAELMNFIQTTPRISRHGTRR